MSKKLNRQMHGAVKNHRKGYSLKRELKNILEADNKLSSDRKKTVGILTRIKREQVLYDIFHQLRTLGYRIQNPRNFCLRHFRALVAHWESQGLAASTIQNKISILRQFSIWIGKGNMIGPSENYVSSPDKVKRNYIAEEDKSWSSHGVDFQQILAQIDAEDKHVGAQLRLMKEFGLRRAEAVCFKPNRHYETPTGIEMGIIRVIDGTKGGRERILVVESDEQLQAVKYAQSIAGKQINAHLGRPGNTLIQSLNRFSYVLAKFGLTKKERGVTGHGLRSEYANDEYERVTDGGRTPVRGGKKGDVDLEVDLRAKYIVSEKLGHARPSITTAYYGSHRKANTRSASSDGKE